MDVHACLYAAVGRISISGFFVGQVCLCKLTFSTLLHQVTVLCLLIKHNGFMALPIKTRRLVGPDAYVMVKS